MSKTLLLKGIKAARGKYGWQATAAFQIAVQSARLTRTMHDTMRRRDPDFPRGLSNLI